MCHAVHSHIPLTGTVPFAGPDTADPHSASRGFAGRRGDVLPHPWPLLTTGLPPAAAGGGKGGPQAHPDRDVKRPSGDRGSRHADLGGKRVSDTASAPTDERGQRSEARSARQPVAASPSPETGRQSPSSPQDAQPGPFSAEAGQHKNPGQPPYPPTAAVDQSRGGSSRCTTTVEACSALPDR